jgi:predicted DNA-binding transcriptional regulator AlpA
MKPRVAARVPDAGMAREELRQHIRALARAAQNAGQNAMLIAPEWILEATTESLRLATSDTDQDVLIKVRAVATRLEMSVSWVYKHARHLPFTRPDPLRPGALRFSSQGLDAYVASLAP